MRSEAVAAGGVFPSLGAESAMESLRLQRGEEEKRRRSEKRGKKKKRVRGLALPLFFLLVGMKKEEG